MIAAVVATGCSMQIRSAVQLPKNLTTVRIDAVSPASPSNDSAPYLTGEVLGDTSATVKFFLDPACAGVAIGSGAASQFSSTGIQVNVPANLASTLYCAGYNAIGSRVSECQAATTYIHDSVAPVVTLSAPLNASVISSSNVSSITLSGTCTEEGKVVNFFGSISGSTPCSGGSFTTPFDFTSIAEGALTVIASQTDSASNIGNASVSVTKDTVGPVVTSVTINSGDAATNSTSVTLSFSITGASQMYVTNTAGCSAGGSWEAYAATKAWTLSQTNATNTVYAKFKDASGNETACQSDTIVHDNVGGSVTITGTGKVQGWINATNCQSISVSGTCSEIGRNVQILTDGSTRGNATCGAGGTYSFGPFVDCGRSEAFAHSIEAYHFDAAGNYAGDAYNINFDWTAPAVTLAAPNGGESWAASSSHAITWAPATDSNSGVAANTVSLFYSTDEGTSWIPIASGEANDGSYSWIVPNAPGSSIRVRITVDDVAGNTGADGSDADFTITP